MELKQKQVLITIWILWNPECLRSVADQFNITKSILFDVSRRICGTISNNLSGQYTYLFEIEHHWAKWLISDPSPKETRWINDPSLDHADQWSHESFSRVDLIDHWSENWFARKERHRSEILIRILSKERTLSYSLMSEWSIYHVTILLITATSDIVQENEIFLSLVISIRKSTDTRNSENAYLHHLESLLRQRL